MSISESSNFWLKHTLCISLIAKHIYIEGTLIILSARVLWEKAARLSEKEIVTSALRDLWFSLVYSAGAKIPQSVPSGAFPGITSRVRSSHSGAQNKQFQLRLYTAFAIGRIREGKSVSASTRHLEVTHVTSIDILLDQTSHLGEPYFNGGVKSYVFSLREETVPRQTKTGFLWCWLSISWLG